MELILSIAVAFPLESAARILPALGDHLARAPILPNRIKFPSGLCQIGGTKYIARRSLGKNIGVNLA